MKPVYFFAIGVVALGVSGWQLASHEHYAANLAAVVRNDDVAGIDSTGSQQLLATYTKMHMGVGRSVFLSGSYARAESGAGSVSNPASNGSIYQAAQQACASHANSIVQADCVQAYIAAHTTAGSNPQAVAPPTKAEYTKAFPSPLFSFDSTGIAFLAALASLVATLVAFVQRRPTY